MTAGGENLPVSNQATLLHAVNLIGHRDHDEIVGSLNEAPEAFRMAASIKDFESLEVKDPERIAYLPQTTLGCDDTSEIVRRPEECFPAIPSSPARDKC